MKNLYKSLAIIAFVAVIGFAFITCDDGSTGSTGGGGGDGWVASNGPWPSEWLTSDSSSFWTITGSISSDHFLQVADYKGWVYFDGASDGTHYQITRMTLDKQGIKVKKVNRPTNFNVTGDEITLCTSWTFQNNRLTLRGTTGVFTVFEGRPLIP